MKGPAHPGDKNFHKSKRSLLECGFREFFYARPRRGNIMIWLKFEDNFQTVNLVLIRNFTTFAGSFCLFTPIFFSRVKIGEIVHACFHARFFFLQLYTFYFSLHGCFFAICSRVGSKSVTGKEINTDPLWRGLLVKKQQFTSIPWEQWASYQRHNKSLVQRRTTHRQADNKINLQK